MTKTESGDDLIQQFILGWYRTAWGLALEAAPEYEENQFFNFIFFVAFQNWGRHLLYD